MNPSRFPRVTFLVHGSPSSIEAVRAHGLSGSYPADRVRFLYRGNPRRETAQAWRQALRMDPPDLIHVVNTAHPGALIAPWWRWRHQCPYFLDTGDVVARMAWSSGIGGGWRLPLLWMVETLALRQADVIIVRGTSHRDWLVARGHRRVDILRDGYLPPPTFPEDRVAGLRQRLGLGRAFVVGVMGSTVYSPKLDICYGWDLLEALVRLKDLPVRGLIIGDGSGLPWLKRRALELGVAERVLFTGRIPYDQVPEYLHLMDVALSTQTNNLAGQVRTTGKLPEYMANARFILASRVGEAAHLLPEPMLLDFEGAVDRSYPQRLADRIRELIAHPEQLELRHQLPERARLSCSYPVLQEAWKKRVLSMAGSGLP